MDELANKMIMYRAKHRLTQEQMAKRCGVSTMTISLIERGIQKPNRVTLAKIQMIVGGGEQSEG